MAESTHTSSPHTAGTEQAFPAGDFVSLPYREQRRTARHLNLPGFGPPNSSGCTTPACSSLGLAG